MELLLCSPGDIAAAGTVAVDSCQRHTLWHSGTPYMTPPRDAAAAGTVAVAVAPASWHTDVA